MDAKTSGDRAYVLGETRDEMGGSEYFAMQGYIGNQVPIVHAENALKLYQALNSAINSGLVRSCHDCSDGGLGVALAETAFSGGLGMEVELQKVPVSGINRNDAILFSETQSRFVVTVSPDKKDAFEQCLDGNTLAEIGRITADQRFKVTGLKGQVMIDADIFELKEAWQKTLKF